MHGRPKTRTQIGIAAAILTMLTGTVYPQGDSNADAVVGQQDFTTSVPNAPQPPGEPSAANLFSFGNQVGVSVDLTTNRLFVNDFSNHRILSWPDANTFATGQAADLVLGQSDFESRQASSNTNPGPSRLRFPGAVSIDQLTGRLAVADTGNNRVLLFDPPFTIGQGATAVLGQPNFGSREADAAADGLAAPLGLAFDSNGSLWVAERDNSRVVRFDPPLRSGMAASIALGQAGFNVQPPIVGSSPSELHQPRDVVLLPSGALAVADTLNNRVVVFEEPFTSGQAAVRAIGQDDLQGNQAGIGSQRLNRPVGLVVDGQGWLFVADSNNHRVLAFAPPLTTGIAARRIIGQPDFHTVDDGTNVNRLANPIGLAITGRGDLVLGDSRNNRVLRFDRVAQPPLATRATPTATRTASPTTTFVPTATPPPPSPTATAFMPPTSTPPIDPNPPAKGVCMACGSVLTPLMWLLIPFACRRLAQ